MSNLAIGYVEISGTEEAVLAFSKRFIANDEPHAIPGQKYFARSVISIDRAEVEESIRGEFKGKAPNTVSSVRFDVDFAWSAEKCLLNGYPQQFQAECITLVEACIRDGVSIEIHTKESGNGFEEYICCSQDGNLISTEESLGDAKCKCCGKIERIASFETLDDLECSSCGGCDFEMLDT